MRDKLNRHIENEYLINEYTQAYIRLSFILIIFVVVTIDTYIFHTITPQKYAFIMLFLLFIFLLSIFYSVMIRKFPYHFQKRRIVLASVIEVWATAYIMYLTGETGVYLPVLLLWYCVGYGIRYGAKIGFITYGMVLITWIVLLYSSPFWIQNQAVGLGWLAAYVLIPLYFFKLLQKLHAKAEEAEYKATHDHLTGLPNRFLFDEILLRYKNEEKEFALVFIDLDKFKEINDTFGHLVGDKVLEEASRRIGKISDFTSRLGGDEFVAIVTYKNRNELVTQLDNLLKSLHQKCQNDDIVLSASIGAAIYPHDTTSSHELKKKADQAMYQAKESGKNRYFLYNELS